MDDDGKIHKLDTVPPPAGESDAYNAPTKVGPVSSNAWADLIREAAEKHALSRSGAATSRPLGEPVPASQRQDHDDEAPPEHEAEIPRLDDDDYALAEPTKVHPRAEPPPLPPPVTTARASVSTQPPPPSPALARVSRPPVFPGWEAGTNLAEQAVRESARKRTRWLAVGIGVGVTVAAATLLALFR